MMKAHKINTFYLATGTIIGTIIGVGVFGVPYAMSQVGLGLALVYVVVLGGIQVMQSLFYAEAAMACEEKTRLIGLAKRYLGRKAGKVAAGSTILGFWGSLIAYILVGGTFLHLIVSPHLGGEVYHYQLVWGFAGSLIVYFGLSFVEKIDFISTVALSLALLLIVGMSVPHIEPANYQLYASGDLFLPYGVILLALAGISAVPEMEDIMDGKHQGFRKAIVLGSIIAIALTTLFALAVYGVTGAGTTEDGMTGLKSIMGGGIAVFAAAFGFLAVATSFFIIGLNLRSSFEYDFKLSAFPSWLLACGIPFGLVVIGVKSFIGIISFTGAVFGGITAVIVSLLYISITKRGLMKGRELGVPVFWAKVSIALLSLGAVYEVASSIRDWL